MTDTLPLWRRVLAGLLGVTPRVHYMGYGWSCPPCKINAGEPADPFADLDCAARGLARHANDSHHGLAPQDAWAGEITWRGHVPPRNHNDGN